MKIGRSGIIDREYPSCSMTTVYNAGGMFIKTKLPYLSEYVLLGRFPDPDLTSLNFLSVDVGYLAADMTMVWSNCPANRS